MEGKGRGATDAVLTDDVPVDRAALAMDVNNPGDPLTQLGHRVDQIEHLVARLPFEAEVVHRHGIGGPTPFAFHRTPGFGDCNWTDIISDLRAGGFKGSIDIEGWHDPVYRDELEMTGQVCSLHYLKQCRGGDFTPNPTS